ncbi:hypothetical protein B0H19DRAFT_134153 [Mycena capillaripes]|nr:hypothetical protein B0H19DRAFT_134153 [Mycena capillaripes]
MIKNDTRVVDSDQQPHVPAVRWTQLWTQLSDLPLELVLEIFVHVNYDQDDRFAFEGTLLVSQVCRLWREISLAEPRLWSYMSMHLWKEKEEFQAAFLSRWLLRAGTRPLSLSLVCEQHIETHRIIPIILSVADR